LLKNWAFGVRDLCVNCAELYNGREKTKNKKQLTQKIKKHMLFSSSDFSSHRKSRKSYIFYSLTAIRVQVGTKTPALVWEVRRGGSRQNCEWAGVDEPLPPFFCIGLFSFPKMDGSLRRHSTFFGGGGFPPRRKSLEDEDSSSNACPHNFISWPPTSQIELTVATTTLVQSTSDSRSEIGGGGFPINKTLIQTQPVRQDLPLHIALCILHIHYILHNLLSTSDDELEAPGTELLSRGIPTLVGAVLIKF
jgi:hypothetical protein